MTDPERIAQLEAQLDAIANPPCAPVDGVAQHMPEEQVRRGYLARGALIEKLERERDEARAEIRRLVDPIAPGVPEGCYSTEAMIRRLAEERNAAEQRAERAEHEAAATREVAQRAEAGAAAMRRALEAAEPHLRDDASHDELMALRAVQDALSGTAAREPATNPKTEEKKP